MAKSITIALLAFALADLAAMAAPSSSEEVASVPEEITEVQSSEEKGTSLPKQEEFPAKEEESRPIEELDGKDEELAEEDKEIGVGDKELEKKDKELGEGDKELEKEDKEINPTKAEACTAVPLFVLHEIKERMKLSQEEAEDDIVRLFSQLNRHNTEEGPVDFSCMMHLLAGAAALDDMEKILSLYAENDGDYFSKVTEGLKELKARMKNALVEEDMVTKNSGRKSVSLGLEMEPPIDGRRDRRGIKIIIN